MTISSGLFKSIGENPSTLVCPALDALPACCFPPPSGKSLTFVPPPDGAPGIVGFDELETLAAEEEDEVDDAGETYPPDGSDVLSPI